MQGVEVFWPLTQSKVAVVDLESVEKLRAHKWCAHKQGSLYYALTRIGKRMIKMHNFLTGWARVDHKDGDGLHNRIENLRPATARQNNQNRRKLTGFTSRFKGVSWDKSRLKWQVQLGRGRQLPRVCLGRFESEAAAAKAYDAAARKYFGEFARLNFP